MAFKAKILSWRFRHLNIVGCLLKRRPTKGGVTGTPGRPSPRFAPVFIDKCLNAWTSKAVAHSNWRQKRRGNDARMPFSLIYFFAPISIFTCRIIMSFRKPCRMPFRKLIPPFTLTVFRNACNLPAPDLCKFWKQREYRITIPIFMVICFAENITD